jgi:Zinc carboxypeptidase
LDFVQPPERYHLVHQRTGRRPVPGSGDGWKYRQKLRRAGYAHDEDGFGKNAIVIDGGNNHPTTQVTAGCSTNIVWSNLSGIHAREWISPAVVTWIISELVENYAAHPELVDNVDWYIMPVINPNDYEFSHTNVI